MILKCILAGCAAAAFGVIFNLRGINILYSGLCGGLGYLIYLLLGPGNYTALFYAGMAITLSAEVIARISKKPATLFLVGGLLPLVPGGEMFQTFLSLMEGRRDVMVYLATTVLYAGALSFGMIIVNALLHLISLLRKSFK